MMLSASVRAASASSLETRSPIERGSRRGSLPDRLLVSEWGDLGKAGAPPQDFRRGSMITVSEWADLGQAGAPLQNVRRGSLVTALSDTTATRYRLLFHSAFLIGRSQPRQFAQNSNLECCMGARHHIFGCGAAPPIGRVGHKILAFCSVRFPPRRWLRLASSCRRRAEARAGLTARRERLRRQPAPGSRSPRPCARS